MKLESVITSDQIQNETHSSSKKNQSMILACIGVVFGDIGTSPLYALKTSFSLCGLDANALNILGITSLIIWSLLLIVSYKYFFWVMPIHNKGEGGLISLMARCLENEKSEKMKRIVLALTFIGIGFFIGDGMITPAISVMSAVEGLSVYSPSLANYVVPVSLSILILLFTLQHKGSFVLGSVFGYFIVLWFLWLAGLGVAQIIKDPSILKALNPIWGLRFILKYPSGAFLAFGGIILAVTGCEALYADLGHFGIKPIKISWFFIVLPCLMLNYLGQATLLLINPDYLNNIFYQLVPFEWIPFSVLIATIASVIASQSIISGIFSIVRHCIMLDFIPRLKIKHTSSDYIGQVYIPSINYTLLILCCLIVQIFQNSDRLSHAYGLSVVGTMLITSILLFLIIKKNIFINTYKRYLAFAIITVFIMIDLLFLGSSLIKFFEGGWVTIVISVLIYAIIDTWISGRKMIDNISKLKAFKIKDYLKKNVHSEKRLVPGTAVFFNRSSNIIPTSFDTYIQNNPYSHEKIIFLTVHVTYQPRTIPSKNMTIEEIHDNIWSVVVHYGYKQTPDIQKALKWFCENVHEIDLQNIQFYFSQQIFLVGKHPFKRKVQRTLFQYLSKISLRSTDFFKIPHSHLIELGAYTKI
ncbi:MAG: potassium transporter Kup [Candidatus Puniceispirillum sp.]|nr:potassium transporter Kup [Candidatus Pelagibacter sp.]MBA4283147.1 potassium transporter Kup [Candidatus Puniceispirillum sp.]